MNAALPLISAVLLAAPSVASGASLSYLFTLRQVTCGEQALHADTQTDDWSAGLSIPAAGKDTGSSASQRSSPGRDSIHVVSSATGDAFRASSFFIVRFSLDEPAVVTLTGSLMFIGATGTSCISLVNLAHPEESVINEIIIAPPAASETRSLHMTRALEAGTYYLDAMVYGGGDGTPAVAGLEMVFSIPEPAGLLPAAGALTCLLRRRRSGSFSL